MDYLKQARITDFADIESLKAIYVAGYDRFGRPVVVFILDRLPVKQINMDKLFLYIINLMDPIVTSDYVFVFFHSPVDSEHRPTFAWLRNAYGLFNRKYKKNLKELHVVKPTRWLKFLAACFRPFLSSKFWKKLHYVEDIQSLQKHFNNRLPFEEELLKRYK